MKRTPLKRKTRLRARRPTPRNRKTVVRLRGKSLQMLRLDCWLRDLCRCRDCGVGTYFKARFDGDPLAYEMAHILGRGAGGSDTLENVRVLCSRCHRKEHGGF